MLFFGRKTIRMILKNKPLYLKIAWKVSIVFPTETEDILA